MPGNSTKRMQDFEYNKPAKKRKLDSSFSTLHKQLSCYSTEEISRYLQRRKKLESKASQLPADVLVQICCFLDTKDIAYQTVMQVCKDWRNALTDSVVWRLLANTFWGMEEGAMENRKLSPSEWRIYFMKKENEKMKTFPVDQWRTYVITRCRAIHSQVRLYSFNVDTAIAKVSRQKVTVPRNVTVSYYENRNIEEKSFPTSYTYMEAKYQYWSEIIPTWINIRVKILVYNWFQKEYKISILIDNNHLCHQVYSGEEAQKMRETINWDVRQQILLFGKALVFVNEDILKRAFEKLYGSECTNCMRFLEELVEQLPESGLDKLHFEPTNKLPKKEIPKDDRVFKPRPRRFRKLFKEKKII